ncbi:hypothetical protein [Bordetella genomosp. 1]|uniref:hypothetical protein n=1 Tax=Bordetella genomosp. 1 TaxID=1395607 RepID=UPI0020CC3557|nr:hypothetical protein [Bordetella genomosp. 1]MDQ8033434.1 hypothetical protein [Bordetella sp.]
MSVNGINMGGVQNIDLSSMDLETALMQVQSQRSQLLEASLQTQLAAVNQRNQDIAKLNEQTNGLSSANLDLQTSNVELGTKIAELKDLQGRLAASKCPDDNGWYGLSWGQGDDAALSHQTLKQIEDAGLTIPTGDDKPRDVDGNGTMDAKGKVVQNFVDQLAGKIAGMEAQMTANNKQIDANKVEIDKNKSAIDTLSNSQQMDMLRLQGLTNKRNEAFDVMTNFVKKMQENRSSIIGNMR